MPLTHLFLTLLVVLIWGFNFVVIKVGLQEIPPLFLCFSRFFLTSIPAIFFIKFPATSLKKVILYGLFMFALPFGSLFMGMFVGVTPGLASLLFQAQVFFSALLAIAFFGEKLTKWQAVGALISFSGIALVGVKIGGSASLLGFFLLIAGAAFWGVGNAVSKKIGKVNMVSLIVWGSFMAWPPLLLLSLVFEGPEKLILSVQHLSLLSMGAVLYITYLSTLLAFALWSLLLHRHRLPTITPFTLLVPIVGMTSSIVVLGEPLQIWKITAGVLVIAGLYINVMGPRLFKKK
ncbi:MAG: EamA family transporter [Simkaniaceae bacterium]|nr:EamA family transporter [Simkaniaceae bacterium]